MSPKTASKNRISAKVAKTANRSKVSSVARSLTASSLSASSPLPSSSSLAQEKPFEEVTTSVEVAALKIISATTLMPLPMPMPTKLNSIGPLAAGAASASASASSAPVSKARMSVMKESFMSYHNVIAMLALLFLFCGLASVDGLKCHMCGQYNEGVGSITPCLNYSDQYAHLYLKDCSKSSEKFCVKYVSELSTVRDCATECAEKEIWETKTYCCNTDGCNGAGNLDASISLALIPAMYLIYQSLRSMMQARHLDLREVFL